MQYVFCFYFHTSGKVNIHSFVILSTGNNNVVCPRCSLKWGEGVKRRKKNLLGNVRHANKNKCIKIFRRKRGKEWVGSSSGVGGEVKGKEEWSESRVFFDGWNVSDFTHESSIIQNASCDYTFKCIHNYYLSLVMTRESERKGTSTY